MAIRIQVSLVSGSPSSSLLSRRLRPSQAKVRSTTHRRGRTRNPVVPGRSRRPRDDHDRPRPDRLRPRHEARLVPLVDPDPAEPGEPFQRPAQHELAAVAFLDIRRVHDHGQQHAHRIDQDVALPAVYALRRVVAARPPFSVVRTD